MKRNEDYSQVKPTYHIGILNFTPFEDYLEFYATNKMTNLKNHYIFNDNFTLNVLDLTQIHLATEENKVWCLDYWAKLFKSSTWEELNMLAQQDDVFSETVEAVYNFNRDEQTRYICEMLEEGERVMLIYTNKIARLEAEVANKDSALAEMAFEMAALEAQLATLQQSR